MLPERWTWAKDGDGQVVLIAGEAGIGKSRLLRALRQQLSGEPHVALSHFCSPYHTNSALHPIIAQLERAAGFVPRRRAGGEARQARGAARPGDRSAGRGGAADRRAAGRFRPRGAIHPSNLSPQRQKQRTLEVLIEQLAGLARDRPVLELYEDLHWVDPSTLELLDLLVERVRAPAGARGAHLPARVQPPVDRAKRTSRALTTEPPRPPPGCRAGRPGHRRQGAAGRDPGPDPGAGPTACRCSSRS